MSLTNYSTLKLYHSKSGKKWELEKDKNFMIGNYAIEEYLSLNWNDSFTLVNNFQYIKHQLELDIKVEFSQSYSQPLKQYGYKYISIQNSGDDRIYYYFITNTEWRSENVVRFHLVMDTLNTFKYMTDYNVGNKTLILREHRDRFKEYTQHVEKEVSFYAEEDADEVSVIINVDINKAVDTQSIEFSNLDQDIDSVEFDTLTSEGNIEVIVYFHGYHQAGTYTFDISWDYACLRRIIDLKSEDISPALYKVAEQELTDGSNTSWSLLYKNDNTPTPTNYLQLNPVSCYIIPKDETEVKIVAPDITNAIVGLSGKTLLGYFNDKLLTLSFDNGDFTYKLKGVYTDVLGSSTEGIEFRISGGNLQYRICWYNYQALGGVGYTKSIRKDWTTFTTCKIVDTIQTIKMFNGSVYDTQTSADVLAQRVVANYSHTYTPSSPQTLSADNIDRTDSKNIKIITLPYCPTTIEINGSDLIFSSLWTYDGVESKLKLNNVRTQFNATFTNDLSVFGELYVKETLDPTTTRSEHLESKLYNSTFYQPKFVYDSFNKYFELENMREVEDSTKFITNFIASRNMVSKFMFSFPQYKLERSLSDYDNIVLVGRNNEEVLYTSAYVDYIKSGFNYDQRAKERNAVVGGISLGLQGIATAGTIAGSIATSNPIGIAAGVGMATGLAASIVSYTKSIVDNDISISRKLDEAKRQAVSVSSVDDVDLLTAYSNNKAKICFYQPTEEVRQALFNLFYYCGYVRNIQGQPNVNSRCWFNFVQAELEIDDGYNMSEEIINDIKYKFSMGVTFFHKYGGNYDLSQTKENVEIDLL